MAELSAHTYARKTEEAQQGAAPNAYPRRASCLVASLPAGGAPRVGVGEL